MTWKRRLYSDIQKQRSKSKVTQSVPGLLVRVEREGGRRPDTSGTNYIVEYLINACGIVSPAESQKIKPGEEPLTYQDLALRLRKQHSGQENTLQLHQHQKENSGGKVSPPKKKSIFWRINRPRRLVSSQWSCSVEIRNALCAFTDVCEERKNRATFLL